MPLILGPTSAGLKPRLYQTESSSPASTRQSPQAPPLPDRVLKPRLYQTESSSPPLPNRVLKLASTRQSPDSGAGHGACDVHANGPKSAEEGRNLRSHPGSTMLRFGTDQRRLLADKLGDAANVAAGR